MTTYGAICEPKKLLLEGNCLPSDLPVEDFDVTATAMCLPLGPTGPNLKAVGLEALAPEPRFPSG